jgi:hypothetical protein
MVGTLLTLVLTSVCARGQVRYAGEGGCPMRCMSEGGLSCFVYLLSFDTGAHLSLVYDDVTLCMICMMM